MLKRALYSFVLALFVFHYTANTVYAQIMPKCPGVDGDDPGEMRIESDGTMLLGASGVLQLWDVTKQTPELSELILTRGTPDQVRRMYSRLNDFDAFAYPHYWFIPSNNMANAFSSIARRDDPAKPWDIWHAGRPAEGTEDTTPFDREAIDDRYSVVAAHDSLWIQMAEYRKWLLGEIDFVYRTYRITAEDNVPVDPRFSNHWVDIALRGTTLYAVRLFGGVWKFDLSKSPYMDTGNLIGELETPKKGNLIRHISFDDGFMFLHDAGANGTATPGYLMDDNDNFIREIPNGWGSIARGRTIVTSGYSAGVFRTNLDSGVITRLILGEGVKAYNIAEYDDRYYVGTNMLGVLIFDDDHSRPIGQLCPWAPRYRAHLPASGDVHQTPEWTEPALPLK
ncbi:MAG: hypothetical protein UZ21_OP11001000668 [Microgenomates bacterium OLB22]|nr:MAG: hypothetical protein UZ21_OP11001000668 [Microgenomates bacterium OLB22]